MRSSLWTLTGICLLVSSCGYRFVGGGSLPGGIKSVYVKIFENRTSEIGVENTFTNDLTYEITRTGGVELVNQDKAEGILSGVITQIGTETVSRRVQKEAAERRLTVYVDLRLTDRNGNVVWSETGIAASETYPIPLLNAETEKNKREAFDTLSKRLAEVINLRLTRMSDF